MKVKLILASFALAVAQLATAQDMPAEMMQPLPLDPQTRVGTLPNGLTYYVRHNEHPRGQANFYIAQKVGSVLEEDNQRGLAHFLEHMCFNGTENFPGDALVRYLESIGVKFGEQLNAYTSVDQTVYNINNVPTQRTSTIDSVLLILHDWSHNLTLDPKEIDKERGVIHEEWRMRSSAEMRIFERQLPRLMSNSRPGNRLPIGTMEVVDNFKPEALRAYYEKWYRPDQQALIIVGDLDVDRTIKEIERQFAPIAMPKDAAEREYFSVPDNAEPIVVSDKDKEMTRAYVEIYNKHEALIPDQYKNTLPGLTTKYAVEMATTMLNTRLGELALDPDCPFLAAGVDDGDFILSKVSKAFATTIMPKEGRMDEAVKKVMSEVYRAARHGFTLSEYDRARTQYLSDIEAVYNNRDKRDNGAYISECVSHFLDHEAMPGIETTYQLSQMLTPQIPVEAINQMLQELVSTTDTNLVILSMNPEKEGYTQPTEAQLLADVHEAQQTDLGAYVDNVKNEPLIAELPKAGTITKEEQGKFGTTVWTLSNGARVIAKQTDFKDNEVKMRAISDGGSGRYGLDDRYDLALLDDVIGASGLGNFTQIELAKAMAGVQASVDFSIDGRSERLEGEAVPKDLRKMFELAYLRFQQPLRDEKTVGSVLNQYREQLRNQAANPMKAFSDSLKVTLYAHNPRQVILEEKDIDRVRYDRILQIYADRFADASDFTFIVVGAFNTDSLREYACQYLATLPTLKRDDTPVDSRVALQRGTVTCRFAKKQEQPTCQLFQVLHAADKFTLKNDLVTDMLGQALEMRLIETVREEMGAAYSASATGSLSRQSDGSFASLLQVYIPVKPEKLDSALLVVEQEIEAISKNGVADKYLTKIKEYMAKTATENERDNGSWLSYIADLQRYGVDAYTERQQTIQAITSDDLRDAARRVIASKDKATVIMLPE